ncbi:hypothetical protein [Acidovorax sp.]|uniref:hypothetical protein n=1 Tax=Acidovorax sp. TaxID=1872122 RepID=UPI00391F7615
MTTENSRFHPDVQQRVRSLFCSHCGGSFEGRQYHKQPNGYGMEGCCADIVQPSTDDMDAYGIEGVHYNLDPLARVHSLQMPGAMETWRISPYVTDRRGVITRWPAEEHVPLHLLNIHDLHDRLKAQMVGDITRIARKDGVWGVLFEIEFHSRESEQFTEPQDVLQGLDTDDQVIPRLVAAAGALGVQFPGVHFAVPEVIYVETMRPAIWAFVPDGLHFPAQHEALTLALQQLKP